MFIKKELKIITLIFIIKNIKLSILISYNKKLMVAHIINMAGLVETEPTKSFLRWIWKFLGSCCVYYITFITIAANDTDFTMAVLTPKSVPHRESDFW